MMFVYIITLALVSVTQSHTVETTFLETTKAQREFNDVRSMEKGNTPPGMAVISEAVIGNTNKVQQRFRREIEVITISNEIKNITWQDWSPCSTTVCGITGQQQRSSICSDRPCQNVVVQVRKCGKPCIEISGSGFFPSNASWTTWDAWSSCNVSCGKGTRTRRRRCISEEAQTCNGHHEEQRTCVAARTCPNWSSWSHWSQCSHSCGKDGIRSRTRNCSRINTYSPGQEVANFTSDNNNTKEVVNSSSCHGGIAVATHIANCTTPFPCNASTWSDWSSWSACTASCGKGTTASLRFCVGSDSAKPCVGKAMRRRTCYGAPCWSRWSSWGSCSKTCGTEQGFRSRVRACRYLVYSQVSQQRCKGRRVERESCQSPSQICHEWGPWGEYTTCTRSCDGGFQIRYRTCPTGLCPGSNVDHTTCNYEPCPYWTTWTSYSCCSASCGEGGRRERTRMCRHGVQGEPGCEGDPIEEIPCYLRACNATLISVFKTFECGTTTALAKVQQRFPILRIFGGRDATITSWPWQASWQVRGCSSCNWRHFCGATLIAPQWVVTAGHCTEEAVYRVNPDDPGEFWSVMLGMQRLNRDGTRHFVRRVFVHDDYLYTDVTVGKMAFADLSLLKLRKAVTLTDKIRPACLPQTISPNPGEKCSITGWGYMGSENEEDARQPVELQQAYVPVMDFNQCLQLEDRYRDNLKAEKHMCAGNSTTAASDSCTGDSGGPLSCRRPNGRWYVAGVTSFGFEDCGTPNHVGIYVPVANFEQWLRNKIEKNSLDDC